MVLPSMKPEDDRKLFPKGVKCEKMQMRLAKVTCVLLLSQSHYNRNNK